MWKFQLHWSINEDEYSNILEKYCNPFKMIRNVSFKQLYDLIMNTQANAIQFVVLSLTLPMAGRALFGSLTFNLTFIATECFKVVNCSRHINIMFI